VVAFLQGPPGARRVQVVAFAGQLDVGPIFGHRKWRRTKRPLVRWRKTPTPVPWGPVRYRLVIDGRRIGTTRRTSLKVKRALPDGALDANVIAIDARGSQTRSRTYVVGIDTARPHGRLKRVKGGWKVWASDATAGVREARLDFGGGRSVEVPIQDYRVEGVRVKAPSGASRPTLFLRDWAGWTRSIG
jgi:hypothetical protein